MPRYRKLPVEIEAFQMPTVNSEADVSFPAWFEVAKKQGTVFDETDPNNLKAVWYVRTLEGVMKINDGDYVIQGVKGEIYPCKPDIFEATYELIEEN